MALPLDLTGERYGRLVALCNTGRKQLRNFIWRFRCDCGNEIERPSGEVRRGGVSSCGCYRNEMRGDHMRKHAAGYNKARAKHGLTGSPTWVTWDSMIQRCENPNHKSFAEYGGAGIVVCPEWHDFARFLADMGERPEGLTLDRFPNGAGNYEPGNCRWATYREQGNNRRTNKRIAFNGREQTVAEWARELGISRAALGYRLRNGWSIEEALTMKIDKGNGWTRGVRE
jgi:hypothetical protein